MSLKIFARLLDHVEFGADITNISIGIIEANRLRRVSPNNEGLFLQDVTGLWVNLYAHYYF